MTRKQYILLFLGAILNSFLIGIIPNYFIAYGVILVICIAMFFAIIVMDMLGKTNHWKGALYMVLIGILSLLLGMGLYFH
jgi:hypothetical protein